MKLKNLFHIHHKHNCKKQFNKSLPSSTPTALSSIMKPATNENRHDKIIQLKRVLSSDPIDWEYFLQLDKDLKVVTIPSLKCSFTWIIAKYPPREVMHELLTRHEAYLFSKRNRNFCNECIRAALKYKNLEFLQFIAWREKELLSQSLLNNSVDLDTTLPLTGDLPLHRAGNVDIAKVLVRAYPKGVSVQNRDGDLPLHLAMKHFRSVDHVKFLIREGKKQRIDHGGVLMKNRYGQSPFSILCKQIETGIDTAYLTFPFYSDDLRLWEKINIVLQAFMEDDNHDRTMNSGSKCKEFQILHSLIRAGCPNQAIHMALIIKPEQIKEIDQEGRYPLSLCAGQRSCPKSILMKILHSYPDALYLPDHYGRLCLHWAVLSGRAVNEGIENLLTLDPGALRIADKDGMLPFMLAALNPENSIEAVYHLLRECPEYFARVG